MIALESLSCRRAPELRDLSAQLVPGELPVVVGQNALEREALVELLAGFRTETSGAITHHAQPLSPRMRRAQVVVLPRHPALTSELTVVDHVRLVARFKGGKMSEAVLQQVLAFSGVDRASRRPDELEPDQKLRLTLALAVAGDPALVVAHDPPGPVLQLLEALFAPGRALVVVTGAIPDVELRSSRLLGLAAGRLSDGTPPPRTDPAESFYLLKVSAGAPALEVMLAAYPGISADRVGAGLYRMAVHREVALAPLVRALVRAGVAVESLEPAARRRAE